jgi:hypothetical protein
VSVPERFAQIRALVQITFTGFRNSYPALQLLTKDSRPSRVRTLDTGFKIAAMKSITLPLLLVFASLAMAQSKPYSSKPRPTNSDLRTSRALKTNSGSIHHSSVVATPSTIKTTTVDEQLNKLAKQSMANAKDSSKKPSRAAVAPLPKTETASAPEKPMTFSYQKPKAGPSAANTSSKSSGRGPGVHGRINGHPH